MESAVGDGMSLIARVQDHVQSPEGSDLLVAMVRAFNGGGSKAVKALIADALAGEKDLREGDAEECENGS